MRHNYGATLQIRRGLPAWLLWMVCTIPMAQAADLPSPSPKLEPIDHGTRDSQVVALTFDACTTREEKVDTQVIEDLIQAKIPATLFLGGKWMEANPETVRRLAGLKQLELGSHAYTHPHLDKVDQARLESEFSKSQQVFKKLVGRKARLFRPPFGDYNDAVIKTALKYGMKTVEWDLPTGDPDPNISLDRLVKRTVENAKPGSIIVMHMNGRGWKTAQALPKIIEGLKARGFHFATVGQLIRQLKQKDQNGKHHLESVIHAGLK